jgi:diguanylate cyclase (GGDEF)-like protein
VKTRTPQLAPSAPETAFERQAIGKIATVIWTAIAFFGALATVDPLRFPEIDVSATRVVVVSATVIAAVTFALPWTRLPKAFLNVLLVLMAGHITALANASGAVEGAPMTLVTFAIALAVCFLPVRTSAAQVGMIAALLATGLVLIDKDHAGAEALRTAFLLSVLVTLCGLVLVLRAVIAQREAAVGHRIFEEDVLDTRAFGRALQRELSRSARHSRPLAIVMVEASGPTGEGEATDRLAAAVGHAILDRIRIEDSAGHVGGLRFGVIVPETPADGAAHVAETLSDVVHETLVSLGSDRSDVQVAVGWADYPHHAETAEELLGVAQHNLEAAAIHNELRPSPVTPPPVSPRAAPAGPDQT